MKKKANVVRGYRYDQIENLGEAQHRLLIGIPMTGTLRSEWVLARYGQVIPCNWSHNEHIQWIDQYSPIRFMVADARNLIVAAFVEKEKDWLLFIDHDVVLPPTTFIALNDYMIKGTIPIVGGLYFTKSVPSEPLLYRGAGTGYFADWKLGDKVWVDGLGMGCTLIHGSIIRALWEESEPCKIAGHDVRRVFETPSRVFFDPEKKTVSVHTGTEDLEFLDRIVKQGILKKAGWPKIAKKPWPFLVDTNIFCQHIDGAGVRYPSRGEQGQFMRKRK